MPRLEVQSFGEEHLDAAAALLAARHEQHRAAEPLLPDALDFRAEIAAVLERDESSGVAGVRDGRLTAYLIGMRLDDDVWGPNAWVEVAGHAAEQAEDVRDLYSVVAADWVAAGRRAHFVLVPASDAALVDAWFRLGFGAQQANAILETPDVAWPADVRPATDADVEELMRLAPGLNQHQQLSPVFAYARSWTDDDARESIVEDLERDDIGTLVVERDGRIVGNFVVCPVELSSMHTGLMRPPGAAYLAFAVTEPDVRGSGAGVALTDACFAWARAHGHSTIVTDWRVTNLAASRFWPRRGFRSTFLRLHRLIA